MPVFTKEELALLNKFADSQPALNKEGKPLGESQIKLGDALALATGSSAKAMTWDFGSQGGTGTVKLGEIPAGAIVIGVVLDGLTATLGAVDAELDLDGSLLLTQDLVAQGATVDFPAVTAAKATAGVVSLTFPTPATAGKVNIIVQFVGA